MQKDANIVEFDKCCQTHIFLQNFVLIQPRTSPPKISKILLRAACPTPLSRSAGRSRAVAGAEEVLALEHPVVVPGGEDEGRVPHRGLEERLGLRVRAATGLFGKFSEKCCSFSAASAAIFATKYAFCSIFQILPDYQADFFFFKFGKIKILQILRHLQKFC